MKKYNFILILMLILLLPFVVLGKNVDSDSNDSLDILYGGTNSALTDPGADRILFWDDGESLGSNFAWLSISGSGLSISGTALTIVPDTIAAAITTGLNATDIANGTVSDAEFQYINSLSSNAQNQLDARCLESVFGTALEADDLELSGTTLQLAAEIPHTDVAETISEAWVLNHLKLSSITTPGSPTDMSIYHFDGATNNPASGPAYDYLALYDTNSSAWKILFSERGDLYFSAIQRPSFGHFTDADAIYSDNTTPHVLVSAETKNTVLTNAQTGGPTDRVYTSHAYDFGMDFDVKVIAGAQIDLEPPSGGKIWLDGIEYAADEHIINDDDTEGDLMHCQSVETADGVYELYCNTVRGHWYGDAGDDSWVSYWASTSYNSTIDGAISGHIKYKVVDGDMCFVSFNIGGTKNVTDNEITFTLPYKNNGDETLWTISASVSANGSNLINPGLIYMAADSATVAVYLDARGGAGGSFTDDEAAVIRGEFFYEIDDGI